MKNENLALVDYLVAKGGPGSGPHPGAGHHVMLHGGSIGNKGPSLVSSHSTKEEAKAKAARMNKQLSPGEKKYYGIKYKVHSV